MTGPNDGETFWSGGARWLHERGRDVPIAQLAPHLEAFSRASEPSEPDTYPGYVPTRGYELVATVGDRVVSVDEASRRAFAGESVGPPRIGIRCVMCGAVSWHPRDVAERYCGRCHRFHEDAGAAGI